MHHITAPIALLNQNRFIYFSKHKTPHWMTVEKAHYFSFDLEALRDLKIIKYRFSAHQTHLPALISFIEISNAAVIQRWTDSRGRGDRRIRTSTNMDATPPRSCWSQQRSQKRWCQLANMQRTQTEGLQHFSAWGSGGRSQMDVMECRHENEIINGHANTAHVNILLVC